MICTDNRLHPLSKARDLEHLIAESSIAQVYSTLQPREPAGYICRDVIYA